MMPVVNRQIISIVFSLWVMGGAMSVFGQGTAFNYQGRLSDAGQPANGSYDMHFAVYDAVTNGNLASLVLTNTAVGVTNGLFNTTLNFGGAVFSGKKYWLEIAVRKTGETNYITLQPRQPILPTPYAIFANSSSNVLGAVAATQLAGTVPSAQISGTYGNAVNFANSGNTFSGTFSGDGSALTGLNGSEITSGTVADARLSANVPLRDHSQTFTGNNVFTGSNTFTGANNFSNWNNYFTGNFFGNGLIGWTNITVTSQPAERDHGYLLNSSSLTTVTLPPNSGLAVGDIVRVSGAGSGGWRIVQNAGQSIKGQFLSASNSTWILASPSQSWISIASSADGIKMVATTASGGGLYTSTDSGQTWDTSSTIYSPVAVSSSSDGTKLVGVLPNNGIIYSVDSGSTWKVSDALSRNWNAVASSADGSKVVAVVNASDGRIFTSSNSGANWVQQNGSPSGTWYAVASSSDGTNLVAALYGGHIFTSGNAGVNWTQQFGSPAGNWTALASSSDGTRLVGAIIGGHIYTSSDSGVTWTATTAPVENWYALASSSDGSRLIAAAYTGGVYVSANSGSTWTQQPLASHNWRAVACSADGSKMVAGYADAAPAGGIYYWQATPRFTATTAGTSGSITGGEGSAVELQYLGGGQFMPISSIGVIWAN